MATKQEEAYEVRRITARARTGALGEAWAAWYLRSHGYRLWARNWRNPEDEREEIDLIANDGDALVFVEVRTRALGAPVPGHASLTIRKKRALRRAASAFVKQLASPWQLPTRRFDLVEVEWQWGHPPLIHHYANISLRTPRPFR